jgi:hypothetical protein
MPDQPRKLPVPDPTPTDHKSLAEALPLEMARVRYEVLPAYLAVGAPGQFAATLMHIDLNRAAEAMAEGDVAAMIIVYQSLKDYSV